MTILSEIDAEPYIRELDDPRLVPNMEKVRLLMSDRKWRTLSEIATESGLRAESVSAHIRDLRKTKNGGYVVDRRPRGSRVDGLFEYRVLPPGTSSPYSGAAVKRTPKPKSGFARGVIHAARLIQKAKDLRTARSALADEIKKIVST